MNAATGTTSAFAVKAGADGTKQTLTVEYADESGTLHEVEVEYTSGNFTLTSKVGGENGAKLTGISTTDATIANLNTALENAGVKATKAGANLVLSATKDGAALTLQIGDTSEDFNQMNVSVGDMHTAALGIADTFLFSLLRQCLHRQTSFHKEFFSYYSNTYTHPILSKSHKPSITLI